MSWALRRATPGDAALLAEHRCALWLDHGIHTEAEVLPQMPVWSAWFHETLDDGTYVAWIAYDAGGAFGSAGLHVKPAMPRPGFPLDRDGRVQSVWVDAAMRRRGVATALMHEIIAYAQNANLIQLVLHPSIDGRALYERLGFIAIDEMALRFPQEGAHAPA